MADEKAVLDARSKYWFDECVGEVKKVENDETAKKMHIYSKKVLVMFIIKTITFVISNININFTRQCI